MLATDSFRSLLSKLGFSSHDKSAASGFYDRTLTDQELLALYRTSWAAKKIVDIPAHDAMRRWRTWEAEEGETQAIEEAEERLGLKEKMTLLASRARLWGAAYLYFYVPGNQAASILRQDGELRAGITADSIRYAVVLNKTELTPNELETDVRSPWFGKPRSYLLTRRNAGEALVEIHPSRLVTLYGEEHPEPWSGASGHQLGDSSLNCVHDALKHAQGTAANLAVMVFDATVDVFGIPELAKAVSDPKQLEALEKRYQMGSAAKGVTRSLIRDSKEEYQRIETRFTGLKDLLDEMFQLLAAAADIPVSRFLGVSARGLNATGEGDEKVYFDKIESMQERIYGPALRILDMILAGGTDAKPIWRPLKQLTDKELSEIAHIDAETANRLNTAGIMTREEIRSSITSRLIALGVFPGLKDSLEEGMPEELEREQEATAAEQEARTATAEETVRNPGGNEENEET